MKKLLFFLPLVVFADTSSEIISRIQSHLLIRDTKSAIQEGEIALSIVPHSQPLRRAYIKALSEGGDMERALKEWQKLDDKEERDILLALSWGLVNQAEKQDLFSMRLSAIIGSAMTGDVRALAIVQRQLRSSNAILRALSIRVAGSLGDKPLKDQLMVLSREEKVWFVRVEAIKALGQLRMKEAMPLLKQILEGAYTHEEEKVAALSSLISIYDRVDVKELKTLVKSPKSALRALACELVVAFNQKELLPHLKPLLKDSTADVRIEALSAFSLLGGAVQVKEDHSPPVAITAAWMNSSYDSLQSYLSDPHPKWRRLAASALAHTNNSDLIVNTMRETKDPYIRVNLALGLIKQRKEVPLACEAIVDFLKREKDSLWMWNETLHPYFSFIAPSEIRHSDEAPQYPEAISQMVHLELLSALCAVDYPHAIEEVKLFLLSETWGVTAQAASLLIEEGDERAMDLVRLLLKDQDHKVRLQAALVLATVASDEAALSVLEEMYPKAEREIKLRILEALAHLGNSECVPFLTGVLKDPSPFLRIVAASALIRCLNN